MCVFTRCRKFLANPDQSGLGKVRGIRIDLDQRFHVASPTVLLVAKFNVNKPCSICIVDAFSGLLTKLQSCIQSAAGSLLIRGTLT